MADIKQPTRKQSTKLKKKGYCKSIIYSPYQEDTPPAHLTSTYFGLSLAELFVLSQLHAANSSRKPSDQLSFQFPQRFITQP
jgi:hypothetical protein